MLAKIESLNFFVFISLDIINAQIWQLGGICKVSTSWLPTAIKCPY